MSDKPTILLSRGIHHGKEVVCIKFKYNTELIRIVRGINGTKWSKTMSCWYITKDDFRVLDLRKAFQQKAGINVDGLYTPGKRQQISGREPEKKAKSKTEHIVPPAYLGKLQQKNYSPNTIKVYTSYFRDFLEYFSGIDPVDITREQINNYILELIRYRDISTSQQNQRINAIKFYYEKLLGREKEYYDISRPKKEKRLPQVLCKEDINKLFEVTKNLKHKCILMTIYSGGLRRGELINLRTEDIDSGRMLIRIIGSKGNKDRYTILSEKLLELLREYYKEYRPKKYLFEGQDGGMYSPSSIENIVKKAAQKAGIRKNITPHSLRHSFATHLLEQGISLRHIQEILGHNSSKTTEIYTHVATNEIGKIKNPLDD
ncbi:MAG: site-specific integrase [Bacteroidales bacterium]|nr:site-specific integrase [Bacteroidales bacterium]